jgi:hypothetical protein
MREFNFFKGYVYLGEIDLPMVRRMSGRTITQELLPVQPMEQPDRLRWIDSYLHNLRFRVYTHLPMEEVQRIVERTISPFIFEPNNQINRERLLRLLQSRFHRAYITN